MTFRNEKISEICIFEYNCYCPENFIMSILLFLLGLDQNEIQKPPEDSQSYFGICSLACYIIALLTSAIVIYVWSCKNSADDISPLFGEGEENKHGVDFDETVNAENE